MPEIPYKFYKGTTNGRPFVEILPGTNTPFGMTEIGLDEFKRIGGNVWIDRVGGTTQLQQFEKNPKFKDLLAGKTVGSGVETITAELIKELGGAAGELEVGGFMNTSAIQEARERKKKIDAGELVDMGGGRFVPAEGSTTGATPTRQSTAQTVLTSEQQNEYFASQRGAAQPLSPIDWLAQQQAGGERGAITNIIKGITTDEDKQLEDLLASSTLADDQKEMLRSLFGAVSSFDEELAGRLSAGLQAGLKITDPFFKSQVRLVTDALERGFSTISNELAFEEDQKTNFLNDLRQDISSARGFLNSEELAELKGIERQYKQDLEGVRNQLAATGFTSSSRRIKREELLGETTGELRESSQRKFAIKETELSGALSRGERDVQSELNRLRQLASEGRLSAFRETESQLGSAGLGDLSTRFGMSPLGGIKGILPQQRTQQITQFARNFIF